MPRGERSARLYALALAMLVAPPARAQPEAHPAKPEAAQPPVQEITPDDAKPPAPSTPTTPTTPTTPPQTTAAPAAPEHVRSMDELTIPKSFLRFGINLFGDTSAFATFPDAPHTGFSVGLVDLRLLADLGGGIDALSEIGFESRATGTVLDVEQLVLRWRRGPGQLIAGRLHVELGYVNTAYHHGKWLQTPIDRPHVARFEDDGGIIPAHWVGVHYILTAGNAAFIVGVGNGRGATLDDIEVERDTNEPKALLVKARYKVDGFEVGASAIYDTIAPQPVTVRPALPDREIVELIGNAYLTLHGDGPIVLGEAYAFHHRASGTTNTTLAGFALVGYQATPWLTPYAEVDVVRGADEDPFFVPDRMASTQLDVVEGIAGVRFETSSWSALKLELRYEVHRNDPANDGDVTAIANWSFGL